MRTEENDCVGCGLPCIGSACGYAHAVHYHCDGCGNEDTLYISPDGQELCADCVRKEFGIDLNTAHEGEHLEFSKIEGSE